MNFKILSIIGMAIVMYFVFIPHALMFLWSNIIVINNPAYAQMDYLTALAIFFLISFVAKIQLVNIRINND